MKKVVRKLDVKSMPLEKPEGVFEILGLSMLLGCVKLSHMWYTLTTEEKQNIFWGAMF